VLTPMTPQDKAELLAQRILKAVSEYAFAGANSVRLTVSIGIADSAGSGIDSVSKLIQAADIACSGQRRTEGTGSKWERDASSKRHRRVAHAGPAGAFFLSTRLLPATSSSNRPFLTVSPFSAIICP